MLACSPSAQSSATKKGWADISASPDASFRTMEAAIVLSRSQVFGATRLVAARRAWTLDAPRALV
jgi:hypothetical protein